MPAVFDRLTKKTILCPITDIGIDVQPQVMLSHITLRSPNPRAAETAKGVND